MSRLSPVSRFVKRIRARLRLARIRKGGAKPTKARSPHWPAVRREYLSRKPECAVCGAKHRVDVHHVRPYHLFPDLELDPRNFLTLCPAHHLLIGHLMSWGSYNPRAREDAAWWAQKVQNRPDGRQRAA